MHDAVGTGVGWTGDGADGCVGSSNGGGGRASGLKVGIDGRIGGGPGNMLIE